jgi:benzoyl-CoA reductase subunit C
MSALEQLNQLATGLLNPAIEDWKAQGKKVVGYFCSFVPEEILLAADVLPYRVRAPGCDETAAADVYLSQVNCTFVRSCLELALQDSYGFLDGLVFTWSCDHIRRLYDLLREIKPTAFPLLHFIDVPHKDSDEAVTLFAEELTKFKKNLETTFAVEISDARLCEAIDASNETRTLLRRVYEFRRREQPPLTGTDALNVVLAATVAPRDHYNNLLRTLLRELDEREGISDYRARLVVAGGACDDPAWFRIIEDLGGLVVADTTCFGSRYFWQPVESDNDPMRAIARSYLRRSLCPRMVEKVADRARFVEDMTRRSRADGVIYQHIRYCDLWGGEQLPVRQRLNDANIPLLVLDREYRLGTRGQLKTRVQAFLERLEG